MQVCDQCNTEIKIVYICHKCGGRFCAEHKKIENHDCIKKNNQIKIIDKISEDSDNNNLSLILEDKLVNNINGKHDLNIDIKNINEKKDKTISKQIISIFFALLLLSVISNGILLMKYNDYNVLSKSYINLYESTKEVNSYYENLTIQYSELRFEYDQLRNLYTNIIERNSILEEEHLRILNFEEEIQLADRKRISIQPKSNYTEIWEIPFSGYIEVNYSSTGELYTWIGSSQIEDLYYSRNPQFPKTTSTQNFKVPVLPDFIIYFANPDETNTIDITYTIIFTY